MGGIKQSIKVEGRLCWTLFDTGARNTYVIPSVAERGDRRTSDYNARPCDRRKIMTDYLEAWAGVREMLDRRYDDLKSGRVKPIDGEAFFESLSQREDSLLKRPPE